MINGVILYTLAIILTGISFMKDRKKTKDALMKSWKMFRNLLPAMLSIMLFVGLSLSILTPSFISSIIGEQSGLLGIMYSAILGSVALIPSFVVFPLGNTLVQHGAEYTSSCGTYIYTHVSRTYNFTDGTKDIWAKLCLRT